MEEKKSFSERAGSFRANMKRRASEMGVATKARFEFDGELKAALETLNNMLYPDISLSSKETAIPAKILAKACGLAFLVELKAGFLFSGKGGTGLVIKKLADGSWSGPSLFALGGVGAGLMVGFSKTSTILLLNTPEAVKVFEGKGQVKLGADLEVTAGPVGRNAGVAGNVGSAKLDGGLGVAPSYAYSHSKGIFLGISIDGSVLLPRPKDNAKFYGQPVSTEDILGGNVEVPESMHLQDLYALLKRIEKEAKKQAMMDGVTSALPSMPSRSSIAAKAVMS